MFFALAYVVLRRLAGWAVGPSAGDRSKDVEILVLRHQRKVLRRQAGRPKLRRIDRVLLAAAGQALPRRTWPSFMVAPPPPPRANAFAERWVRTVRNECLDWMLILGRRRLEHVLQEYGDHYNPGRPHRGLGLGVPDPEGRERVAFTPTERVRRRDVLGGLIHEYELAA